EQDFAKDPRWRDYINNNGFKTFKILFDQEFMGVAVKRFKSNEEFFKMLLKDKKLFEEIRDALGSAIYSRVENNVMNYGLPDKVMHGMFDLVQPETTQLVADKNIEK
ncbi:MAG: type I restriction endonuclease subunit R, partial [Veillonella sp.]